MNCPRCQRENVKLFRYRNLPLLQCPCGALFATRFRRAWPLFPRIALSPWEPIWRPRWPKFYYGYVACLRQFFQRLRHGARLEDVAEESRTILPLCDLIRFWDESADKNYRAQLPEPTATRLQSLIDQACNDAIEMPELSDLPQFHAVCDFASWGLARIADGQMSQATAGRFGYDLHNFPEGGFFADEDGETKVAWVQAAAGRLPTVRRAEVQLWFQSQLR